MCFNSFVMEDAPQRKGTLAVGILFVFISIAVVSLVLKRYQSSVVNLTNRILREQSQVEKREIGFKQFISKEEFQKCQSQKL